MGTAIVEAHLENYLKSLCELNKLVIGLIIGQPNKSRENYIVHFAKSLEDDINEVINVDNSIISTHALNVIRMIPGGFHILGIFIISLQNVFEDDNSMNRIRIILQDIKNALEMNRLFYASSTKYDDDEKLILYVSPQTEGEYICKSIQIGNDKSKLITVDFEFQDNLVKWVMIETFYEQDEIFPLIKHGDKISVEENFMYSLDVIDRQIGASEVFIDGESHDDDEFVKIIQAAQKQKTNTSISADIYFPYVNNSDKDKTVLSKFQGTVRYVGVISSRIWIHEKNNIKDIKKFIKNDIMRSLASRIQIYCDSLIENEINNETVLVNEVPRRVFFNTKSNIQFSDYLFRGEDEDTAIEQAKEILDINLEKEDIFANIEIFKVDSDKEISQESKKPENQSNHMKLFLGIGVAVLIVLISVIVSMFKNDNSTVSN